MATFSPTDPPPVPAAIAMFVENKELLFRAAEGHMLYTYDKDTPGKSTCTGNCAQRWLPVVAPPDAKPIGDIWTPIVRPDKSLQWSYKGKALYVYADDEPGEAEGDGVDGVWHLFKP